MSEESLQFDLRFVCFLPEIDLNAAIKHSDSTQFFLTELKEFADKGPSFVRFLNDPNNLRNPVNMKAGVTVLMNILYSIGMPMLALNVTSLETSIKNKNRSAKEENLEMISNTIEYFCARARKVPLITQEEVKERIGELPPLLSDALKMLNDLAKNGKKKVLMVDDMPDVLSSVGAVLSDEYEFYALANSGDLPDFLQTQMVDIFILDIEMPGLDGFSLLNLIRSMEEYENSPIMFLTGNAKPDDIKAAMSAGIDGFIRKPFDNEHLLSKMRELAEKTQPRVFFTPRVQN